MPRGNGISAGEPGGDATAREWYYYDFLVVMADAYIDHPSFGSTLIARLLEAEGYQVAVLAQPDWHDCHAFTDHGKAPV
ncbi:MAG: hypothetical protein ACLUS6_03795 [Dysosmobacter sp.]